MDNENTVSERIEPIQITVPNQDLPQVTKAESLQITGDATVALQSIANSFAVLADVVKNTNIASLLEGYALMKSLGDIMAGLTANAGRKGLDASTMKQDAVDGTHRVLEAFDHLSKTLEARRTGDFKETVDAEAAFNTWKEPQP